jgi:photosystem II stability/assembly factor-like uncharacterized protein
MRLGRAAFLVLLVTLVIAANSQTYDQNLFKEMKWRLVGPFRGGRALAVTGVAGEPNLYYFGAVAGGVWKSVDSGANWRPLFDQQPIASIGAIAVADSDHNVIYVGSGEACIRGNISYGDGVYKSTDGGKTWKNVGLRDTRHIGAIIVHPRNPDIALVAALGHAYGPNAQRGIFRTADGGKTWDKVLYKDERTGGIDVVFDPENPNVTYAALWQVYRTPWSLNSGGPGSGLYKSTDGGITWVVSGFPSLVLIPIACMPLLKPGKAGYSAPMTAVTLGPMSTTTNVFGSAPGTSPTSSPIPRALTRCTSSILACFVRSTVARPSPFFRRPTAIITVSGLTPPIPTA